MRPVSVDLDQTGTFDDPQKRFVERHPDHFYGALEIAVVIPAKAVT